MRVSTWSIKRGMDHIYFCCAILVKFLSEDIFYSIKFPGSVWHSYINMTNRELRMDNGERDREQVIHLIHTHIYLHVLYIRICIL